MALGMRRYNKPQGCSCTRLRRPITCPALAGDEQACKNCIRSPRADSFAEVYSNGSTTTPARPARRGRARSVTFAPSYFAKDDGTAPPLETSRPTCAADAARGITKRGYLAFGVEPSTRKYRLRLARYKSLAEIIAARVRRRPRDAANVRLLDIGCGNGRTLRYLQAEGVADRVDLHGVELSERRIAGMYGRRHWRLVRATATDRLPFADASFDCVICEQVLEHLHEPDHVIREIARMLRPGGCAIIGVPSFPPILFQVRRHLVPLLDRVIGRRGDHVQVFSAKLIEKVIRDSGHFDSMTTRGFRILSGGPLSPLEDHRWYWQLNKWIGRAFPSLCTEVQVVAERSTDAPTHSKIEPANLGSCR